MLVADDRVDIAGGIASAPARLQGMLEVRGLGLMRLPFLRRARLALLVQLGRAERLPHPATHPETGLRSVMLEPHCPAAPLRIRLALAA